MSSILDKARTHAAALVCLVVLPVAIGLLHDGWLFTPIAWSDPWYNVGYFLNYFDATYLPGYYKEARAPWLLIGNLAYAAFGAMNANFILHVGALSAAGLFTYLTLARLTSRTAGLIAAVLLCAYYPFHNAGGWDYQSTPSGAFYALTLYLLTRAGQSDSPDSWLVGAGAAFAATIHTDVLFINMGLGLAAHYLVASKRPWSAKETAEVAGWVITGFAALTLALCAVAWSAGREPLFFTPMVKIVVDYTASPQATMGAWWVPWSSGWFLTDTSLAYLTAPFLIAVAGAVFIAGRVIGYPRGTRRAAAWRDRIGLALVGQYVLVAALWVIWQSVGHVALQPDYFAYPLIVPAFVAVGAMVGTAGRREMIALAIAMAAVVVTATAALVWRGAGVSAWWVFAAMAAVIVAGAVRRRERALCVIAAGAIFLAGVPLTPAAGPPRWSQVRIIGPQCRVERQAFAEITQLHALLYRDNPERARTVIWDGPAEILSTGDCKLDLGRLRAGVIASGVYPLGAMVTRVDALDAAALARQPGDRIAALVPDKAQLAPLIQRFAAEDRRLQVVYERPVTFDAGKAYAVVLQVAP